MLDRLLGLRLLLVAIIVLFDCAVLLLSEISLTSAVASFDAVVKVCVVGWHLLVRLGVFADTRARH